MDRRQKSEIGKTKPLSKRLKRRGAEVLKKEFLECFGVRTSNAEALRLIVKELIQRGVSRQTLLSWAMQAGYTSSGISSVLSRILCSIGLRARKAGAGRKPSRDALEILAHARSRYGERFLSVLRGAWRAGQAQASSEDSERSQSLIAEPQLGELETNCRAAIRRGRKIIMPKLALPPESSIKIFGKIKLNHQRKGSLR